MAHRNFTDLLGRLIKNGSTVIYIWSKYSSKKKAHGGGAIKYILGTVVGVTNASIKIEHFDPNKKIAFGPETIRVFNTKEKIIVIKKKDIPLEEREAEDIIAAQEKDLDKYKKEISEKIQAINRAESKIKRKEKEIEELKYVVEEYENDLKRFNLLDL